MTRLRNIAAALGAIVIAAVAMPAQAHSAESLSLGFTDGFLHPLSGPDHLLAMVAVGLWGAFLGRPLIYLLPVIFPMVMAFGALLAIADVALPPVELGIAMSVLALGIAIVMRWRAPVWLASVIVGIFGLFHGYAHGLELPSMANPTDFGAGFMLATGMLHLFGIAVGELCLRARAEGVLRVLGGAVGLSGIYYLAQALGA